MLRLPDKKNFNDCKLNDSKIFVNLMEKLTYLLVNEYASNIHTI